MDHPVENQARCLECGGECCRSFPALDITWPEFQILQTHGAGRLYFSLTGHHKLIIENGCEFLIQGRCSIYADRPAVCRHFICLREVPGPLPSEPPERRGSRWRTWL